MRTFKTRVSVYVFVGILMGIGLYRFNYILNNLYSEAHDNGYDRGYSIGYNDGMRKALNDVDESMIVKGPVLITEPYQYFSDNRILIWIEPRPVLGFSADTHDITIAANYFDFLTIEEQPTAINIKDQ